MAKSSHSLIVSTLIYGNLGFWIPLPPRRRGRGACGEGRNCGFEFESMTAPCNNTFLNWGKLVVAYIYTRGLGRASWHNIYQLSLYKWLLEQSWKTLKRWYTILHRKNNDLRIRFLGVWSRYKKDVSCTLSQPWLCIQMEGSQDNQLICTSIRIDSSFSSWSM